MAVIDWHAHWFSPRLVERLRLRAAAPRIHEDAEGRTVFTTGLPGSVGVLPVTPGFVSVDERLGHMDRHGVDRQLLSWPTTLGTDALLPTADAKLLWRDYNDDLGSLVAERPDRFLAVAALPTGDPEWAAAELDRAHRELGLIGAVLPVGAFFSLEGARHLTPIFEVAQRHRSHIYLHTGPASAGIPGQLRIPPPGPGEPARPRWLLDSYSHFAGGVFTLAFTDFLDPWPDVTVQVAMLGGATAFLAEGVDAMARGGSPEFPKLADPRAALRRLYYDAGVVGRGARTLSFSVEALGADRILFGSDYPLPGADTAYRALAEADLSDGERRQILSTNGEALLAARQAVAA